MVFFVVLNVIGVAGIIYTMTLFLKRTCRYCKEDVSRKDIVCPKCGNNL
jgi:hypothetical protein